MKWIIERLYRRSPEQNIRAFARRFSRPAGDSSSYQDNLAKIELLFSYFTVDNIDEGFISKADFKAHIEGSIGKIDYKIEGFSDDQIAQQRDLSIKFHWGHNHDFGDFYINGRNGKHHLTVLSQFMTAFPISLDDFLDKDILDIGCWTGGTTLSLSMLKPKSILAVEEVVKYLNMTEFLLKSFSIKNVSFFDKSLYALNDDQFFEKFDIIYFPGVIYHLTDPVLALRILYNSLRQGGVMLLESASIPDSDSVCRFDGCHIYISGTKGDLSRGGWNWFIPSTSAVERMLYEAGFDHGVQAFIPTTDPGRLLAYAEKHATTDICRAGLSVPNIR